MGFMEEGCSGIPWVTKASTTVASHQKGYFFHQPPLFSRTIFLSGGGLQNVRCWSKRVKGILGLVSFSSQIKQ